MKWNNASNYSREDLAAMQKDAMERVREMQRRADETLRRSNQSMPQPSPPPPVQKEENPSPPPPPPKPLPQPPPAISNNSKLSNILSIAGMDSDRLIILGLLLILWNDNADHLLLLALLYLLL